MAPNRSTDAASSPSVGSSSSQSGAARQRQPCQRQPAPLSRRQHARRQIGEFPQPDRSQASRTIAAAQPRREPQVLRARSAPASPHPGARHRPRAAHAPADRPAHPRRPSQQVPAAGRSRPASSRSSVDLPDPFGPVSSSAPPAATAKSEVAEHQPLAAERRQTRRLQHIRLPALWTLADWCDLSPPRQVHCLTIAPAAHRLNSPLNEKAPTMKAIGQDTLKTRRTLTVQGKSYDYFSLAEAAKSLGDISRLPVSLKVLLENVLRFEDGTELHGRRCQGDRRLARRGALRQGGAVQARAHPAAGFHRRPRGGRSGGDARWHHPARRRSAEGQPAGAGGSGDRPLGADRRVRAVPTRWPGTWTSSSSATASATGSSAGARTHSTTSASCRRAPASATR